MVGERIKSMKKPNNSRGFIVLSIFLLIIVPTVWFILDTNDMPSKLGVPVNSIPGQWSIVLIGYFASVAGAITGFIATAYSVKKTIENQNKSRQEDNAIAALPLIQVGRIADNHSKKCDAIIECKYDAVKDLKNKTYTTGAVMFEPNAKLSLKNVGQREMYNLRAKCIGYGNFIESDTEIDLLPIIYKDEEKIIGLNIRSAVAKKYYDSGLEYLPEPKYSVEKVTIEFIFDDCYGNKYKQLAQADVTYMLSKSGKKIYQIFENSTIKYCKITSAPSLMQHKNNS